MSLTTSIAKHTLLQIIGRTIGTVLGLISVALLTRYLGQSGYGAFTTITGFLQFFGILVDFGLTLTTVQMISESNAYAPRIMGNIFTLRLISALVFFGLAPIIVLFFPYPPEVKIGVAVGSIAFLCMTMTQVQVGVFQKNLAMERVALAEVASRAVLLIGIMLAIFMHAGLLATIWALVAGNVVQFLVTLAASRRLIPFSLAFDRAFIIDIIKRSWPIGLSITFNLIYLKGDVVILSLFHDQAEVGLYGAAYKVLDVVTVIPMMFMGLVLPTLVEVWNHDHETFQRRLQKAFDFSAIIALPLVGGALVLGRDIMTFVAGNDFATSGTILKILIIAAGAVFFSGLYGHTVIAIGKQRRSIWGYGIDAALSIIAYLIIVPRFGALGAAWVTVFSELFIMCYLAILVARTTGFAQSVRIGGKALMATLIMMAMLYALAPMHIVFMVIAGTVIYGTAVLILRAISMDTIREFKNGLTNRS